MILHDLSMQNLAIYFFVYGFCDGNSRATVRECHCWYPNVKLTNRLVSATVHASQKENKCSYTTSAQ
jgi:hypothetical protein